MLVNFKVGIINALVTMGGVVYGTDGYSYCWICLASEPVDAKDHIGQNMLNYI